jgi:hypothetical protein
MRIADFRLRIILSSIGRRPFEHLPSGLPCLFGSALESKRNFPHEKQGSVFQSKFLKMKNDRVIIAANGQNPARFQPIFLDLGYLLLSDPIAVSMLIQITYASIRSRIRPGALSPSADPAEYRDSSCACHWVGP